MMLMPSNHSSGLIHYLAGKYPGRIGWLQSPSWFKPSRHYLPYACDNDAYVAHTSGKAWDADKWLAMLDRVNVEPSKPIWCLVPDVVADRAATLRSWEQHSGIVKWPKAFAVQDGMEPSDVPDGADVVFVGGTTSWKWRTLPMWTASFPRVHVGRVNSLEKLWVCERHGVESVDGTGWFREGLGDDRMRHLQMWLDGVEDKQMEMI